MKKITALLLCVTTVLAAVFIPTGLNTYAYEKHNSKIARIVTNVHNKEKNLPPSSDEIEEELIIYDNTSKKYHTYDIWENIVCVGRIKNNSVDGYYKKGDLVRIIGKYKSSANTIVYTKGTGVNYVESEIIEFLPLEYQPEENEKFNDMPVLPAEDVLEEAYIYIGADDHGLPCYRARDEYYDDYGSSLEVSYDKSMIRRYGKLNDPLTVYSSSDEKISKTTVPKGSYVGIMEYRYGEKYGMFTIYNNGKPYYIPEFISVRSGKASLELMDYGFVPSGSDKVYGMDSKTALNQYAYINTIESDKTKVIKKIAPKAPLYFCFKGREISMYNITGSDTLDVIDEDSSAFTCLYDELVFKVDKNLFFIITTAKKQ